MKEFMRIICFFCALLLGYTSHAQNLRIDVITSMHDATRIQFENDKLIASTLGGLLIYDLTTDRYQSWTVADGFYSQRFTAFTKTPHNIIALGSSTGILSFLDLDDGHISNEISLQGNNIVDMLAVGDTLWVLAENLVAVYNYNSQLDQFRFIDFFQNVSSAFSGLTSVHHARNRIWIGSTNGIFTAFSDYVRNNLKSSSNWIHITSSQGLPSNSIYDITGNDTSFFLASAGGLVRMDGQSITLLQSGAIRKVRTFNDEIFVSNDNNIYRYEAGGFVLLRSFPSIAIRDFDFDENGNIWAALAQRGVVELGADRQVLIDGPLSNAIGDVHLDRRGWLWCTSRTIRVQGREGVFLRTNSEWINYKYLGPGIWQAMSQTVYVFEDTDGNIWISAWNGGISIFDENLNITPINRLSTPGNVWRKSITIDDTIQVETPVELQNVLSGQLDDERYTTATDFYLDTPNRSIWLLNLYPTSDEPIVRFRDTKFSSDALNPNMWRYYSNPETSEWSNHLVTITRDIFGIYWFASDQEGIYRMQIDEQGNRIGWDSIDESDNIKSNSINDLEADEDGYVWIGSQAGLNAYLGGTIFDFREDFQPIGFRINDIYIDSENNKWFATDKGLSLLRNSGSPFDPASWIHIVPQLSDVTRQGVIYADLPSENIHSVFLDENTGDLYLGTDSGIAIIRSNPFASPFTSYENVRLGPNPFRISANSTDRMTFYGLISGSEVKILTANGKLVRRLNPNNFNEVPGSQAYWDGRNMEGELVSSGVYVYMITTENGESKAGKLLVIRE